jgi:predicted RNase H-like nuclease
MVADRLTHPPARTVAGVDGCRAGWVAVLWRPGAAAPESLIRPDWPAMAAALAAAAAICVDIPIGLADAGRRDCDGAARALLGRARKGASVFPPPRRYMLGLGWPAASEAGQARGDGGLSIQAYNIMPKIAELDRALAPEDQARVYETHPELAFHRRNAWAALPPKARSAGRAPRLELLRAAGLPAPDALLDRHPRKDAKADDLLDAAVCAVVARDLLAGRAQRVPAGEPPTDARGLRMEIWF